MLTLKRLEFIVIVLVEILILPNGVTAAQSGQWWGNLEGRVTLAKEEFLLGEPISIKVALTNRHMEVIHVWDMIDRIFEFSAQDSSGRLVKGLKKAWWTGLFRTVAVPPGSVFNEVVFMNEYLKFPGPGVYTVTYRGYAPIHKGSRMNQDRDVHAVSLSGVTSVKLRKASVNELENVLREYLKQLKSGNHKLESQAARALSVSEPVLAVKLLKQALEAESGSYPHCAIHATWALAKIGTEQAIQALLDLALHANHWMVRIDAIRELGRWHIKRALRTLTALLSDPSARIRIAALRSLGDIGDESCIPEVELRFNDPDEKVRNVAGKVHKILTEGDQDAQKAIKEAMTAAKEAAAAAKEKGK